MSRPAPPPQTVRIIRLAMLAGIVLFLVVAWYLRISGSLGDPNAELADMLAPVAAGLQVAALAAIFVVRWKLNGETDAGIRFTKILVASAFAEGGALVGILAYLLGGAFALALAGVLIFLVSLIRLPYEA